MSRSLSTCDLDFFSTLPRSVREEIETWLEIVEEVEQAKNLEQGARAAAEKHGHIKGCSFANIKRKVRRYQEAGWQGLVNKSRLKKANAAMEIGEHFKGYCEGNQRSSQEAWRQMMRDFRAGKYFEDVGTWREVWATEHPDSATPYNCPRNWTPKGWTYRNLMRTNGLTKYEICASRVGRGKARDLLPSVYSSRVGLPVGAMYMFDDMWHDAKINFPGNTRAQRVIELACVDVASACRCAWGIKPRREDLDTGRMRNLNECDMRQILAHMLVNIGYHPEGCRMVVEHGTAAAGEELEQLIGKLTNGVVRFERSGIVADPIHKGLWCGQPRGNYKRKAALESQHGLAHSVAAALQGQIGKDRDHSPEQMYGLEQYNNQLIRAAAALPPERARLLTLPLLDFNTYVAAIAELYREMNLRDWHDLEGWEECGYTAVKYRVSPLADDWFPATRLLDLPQDEYLMLYNTIQAFPEKYSRTFRLSPQEVFDENRDALVRLPKSCTPRILGERLAVLRTLRSDGLIVYGNQEYGPSEFRYLARTVTDPNGFEIALRPGMKVAIHINPFNTDECFVSDAESGAYIGLARRWQTVCKTDVEALERMAGKQAAIEAELRAPIARRGAKLLREKAEMHRRNSAVLRGDAVSDDEVAREERDLRTRITDEEREAVLVPVRARGEDFSEDEIDAMIGGRADEGEDEDYSELI